MPEILVAGCDVVETRSRALLLELLGHTCEIAASFDEAAARLKADSSIRLVLLDEDIFSPDGASGSPPDFSKLVSSSAIVILATRDPNSNFPADAVIPIPISIANFAQLVDGWLRRKRISPRRSETKRKLRSLPDRRAQRRR